MKPFVPPYPRPGEQPRSRWARLLSARRNSLRIFTERHYSKRSIRAAFLGRRILFVNEPAGVRRILVDQWQKFPKGSVLTRMLAPAIGNGVLISNGEMWKRQRRMIDPAFDQRSLEDLFPLMAAAVDAMLERFQHLDPSAPIEADEEMTRATADIICRALCSVPLDDRDGARLFDAFTRYQNGSVQFAVMQAFRVPSLLAPAGWRVRRAGRDIRAMVGSLARERYDAFHRGEADPHKDLLAALIAARDPETGVSFSFEELVEHMIVLFIAGHETTASTLAWALHTIANCPHVQERLYAEVMQATKGRPVEFADIKRFKLTRDVLRETLRLYPPIGFIMRDATETGSIAGREVCPGQTVVASPWLMQRHRKHWERPDEFDPDRFNTESAKASLKIAYLPFGLGPRTCMGAGFAMQEGALLLASLVQRYRILPVPEHVPETASRLTIRSANGIKVRLENRERG
jgi:cytochrome P450